MQDPLRVSVVIPTIGRTSVYSAVESCLQQSHAPLEVIVGADTEAALNLPQDSRVRVVRCGPGEGGNAARSAAIKYAEGSLIALLDDDDVWHPEKLETQLHQVTTRNLVADEAWVITSRVVDTDGSVRPVHLVGNNENPLSYLFEKRSVRGGVGKFHTSTLIFPKKLVEAVPFEPSNKFFQDTTWYIQIVAKFPKIQFVHCPEALVEINRPVAVTTLSGKQGSVSLGIDWRKSIDWVRREMTGLNPRWRGDYVLVDSLPRSMRSESVGDPIRVMIASFVVGRPGWAAIINGAAKIARYYFQFVGKAISNFTVRDGRV